MWWLIPALAGFVAGAGCLVLAMRVTRRTAPIAAAAPSDEASQTALALRMTRIIAEARGRVRFVEGLDDAATLLEVDRLIQVEPQTPLIAPIRDRNLRRAALQRLETMSPRPKVRLFSVAERLAGDVIGAARLYDHAYWRDHDRVHAVIIGFTALGRTCMDEAIFAGIAGEFAPPQITILDPAPASVRASLEAQMPEIARSIDLEILPFVAETVGDGGPWAAIAAKAPVTAIFLCLDGDEERLKVAAALRRLQTTVDPTLGPIFVLSEKASAAAFLFGSHEDRSRGLGPRLVVADGLSDDHLRRLLDPASEDMAAQRLHDAYRVGASSKSAADVPWAALGETYREASRHAGEHLAQKLWTAGLLWPAASKDPVQVTREAYASVIEPCATGSGEDHLMRRLARLEHDRWCAERRLDGWTYGPRRDEDRRTHPSLTSFDDPRFPDGEIRKDIDQIRYLFGKAVTIEDQGAAPPIVIGFDMRAEAKGVSMKDAVALIEGAPWRPVFVIAQLADDGERHAVDEMMTGLTDAGRRCRLLVVADRADIERPANAELVLVGSPRHDADTDHWYDPTVPADTAFDFSTYLARRAHAIVSTVRDKGPQSRP